MLIDDNQHVFEGQIQVILDPNDYKVGLDHAKTALMQQAVEPTPIASWSWLRIARKWSCFVLYEKTRKFECR